MSEQLSTAAARTNHAIASATRQPHQGRAMAPVPGSVGTDPAQFGKLPSRSYRRFGPVQGAGRRGPARAATLVARVERVRWIGWVLVGLAGCATDEGGRASESEAGIRATLARAQRRQGRRRQATVESLGQVLTA